MDEHIGPNHELYGPKRHNAPGCPRCKLNAAAPDLLTACEQQHEAIDRLFAMLITAQGSDKPFFPSKCGQPWDALCQGNAAIAKATD